MPIKSLSQASLILYNYDTLTLNDSGKQIKIYITNKYCKTCLENILSDSNFLKFAIRNSIDVNIVFYGIFDDYTLLEWYEKIKFHSFDNKLVFKILNIDLTKIYDRSPYLFLSNGGQSKFLKYSDLFKEITFDFKLGYSFFEK